MRHRSASIRALNLTRGHAVLLTISGRANQRQCLVVYNNADNLSRRLR
jgi:hypothetical protein